MIKEIPDIKKGILWILFSVTATFSTLFLPIHILSNIIHPQSLNKLLPDWLIAVYLVVLATFAIHHAIYRLIILIKDL